MYSNLYEVCNKHYWHDCSFNDVVIPEPYIPHFPIDGEHWNGVLIMVEAQNLSDTNLDYRQRMIQHHNAGNLEMLYNRMNLSALNFPDSYDGVVDGVHSDVAISPWKNGVIPFAVSSVAKLLPKSSVAVKKGVNPLMAARQVAVSNAVPWSRIALNNRNNGFVNANPNAEAISKSKQFWADMLVGMEDYIGVFDTMEIWAFGQVAYDVCTDAARITRNRRSRGIRILKLPPPFQMNLNLNTNRFRDEAELFMSLIETEMQELINLIASTQLIKLLANRNLALSLGAVTARRYIDQQLIKL